MDIDCRRSEPTAVQWPVPIEAHQLPPLMQMYGETTREDRC